MSSTSIKSHPDLNSLSYYASKIKLWDYPRSKALVRAASQHHLISSPSLCVGTVCFVLCLTYVWPSLILNELGIFFNHTALVLLSMNTLQDFSYPHPDMGTIVLSGVQSHGPSSLTKLSFLKHNTDRHSPTPNPFWLVECSQRSSGMCRVASDYLFILLSTFYPLPAPPRPRSTSQPVA